MLKKSSFNFRIEYTKVAEKNQGEGPEKQFLVTPLQLNFRSDPFGIIETDIILW